MADAAVATPSKPVASTASPKVSKTKSIFAANGLSNVPFGCGALQRFLIFEKNQSLRFLEHTERFSKAGDKQWKTFLSFYTKIIETVHDKSPVVAQTYKRKNGPLPSLKPTFLCVQCPTILSQEAMRAHFHGPKSHSFCTRHQRFAELGATINV